MNDEQMDGRMAFKLKEVAVLLGVSRNTVGRLIARGLLKASGALRHKVISRAEIERFLADETPRALLK